jgi:hypothetical protein
MNQLLVTNVHITRGTQYVVTDKDAMTVLSELTL